MKTKNIIAVALMVGFLLPAGAERAAALSCLPVDMYLKDVIGKEEVVIFEATSIDRIEESDYTAEVLTVTDAHQGWVENKLFVYHEKHPDWGYLCNSGPKVKGSTGVYIASRDAHNKYTVHQRLELRDPLVTELKADLAEDAVEGGVSEQTSQDRMNQIMTSIHDLFKQVIVLLKEHSYWKKNG